MPQPMSVPTRPGATRSALRSIGTLGGGNHFIELDRGEDGGFWLIIHSGSRHLGVEAAAFYQGEAFRQSPPGTPYELAYASGELMDHYLHDMKRRALSLWMCR